ncbi:MAG TPA: winged helix DNA-binding domain-containing protein, partial [Solirubrobacteraceae bacterium]|nr:winged helix DNA-binding domain-containing protein [Solirubrobacteraceae bacterium]
MTSLSWESVLAWRLRRQHLAARAQRDDADAVISEIAGLHAQVFSSAELTLWARVEELEPGWLARALWDERALVKTWAMRGTLHLLRSDELAGYVGALARLRPRHHVGAWQRASGLTREQADAMLAAVAEALDGEPLTRAALSAAVAERVGDDTLVDKLGRGFGDLLKPAAFTGDLCFAPNDGRLVRFTRPASWIAGFAPPGPDEAASKRVLRTYLRAYGPAPREQFQRWFGMTSPAEAGRWIASLGDAACEVDVEGARGWMLAEDVEEAEAAAPSGVVRLLPGFDHYVVAAPRDGEAVLAAEHRARVYRPQGWLSPVLLVDGRMAGVWSHEVKCDRVA